MRRRIAALLSAALLTTMAVLATASPASASTTVCFGQGSVQVTPGLSYPITRLPTVTGNTVTVGNTAVNAAFVFQFTPSLGACVPGLAKILTASGTVTGYCGHSVGRGTTSNGHAFAWTSAGGFLMLTGDLVGVVLAVPDTFNGEGCSPMFDVNGGGAQGFIVTGAVLLTVPCASKTKQTTLLGPFHQLILTLAHVTVEFSMHLSAKVCIA